MSFDPVPWFVGGGAQHSPEVARLLAYAATNGAEGVISPGDLKVVPLDIPGSSVRVLSGAFLALNKAAGGSQQTYVGRNPTEDPVAISATGSGGGRSDLIVARVEDPFMPGEPWADPADVTVGPYVFSRVVPNVPSSAIVNNASATAYLATLGYSAIPLAAVSLPANTGTITDPMIKDLRGLSQPRSLSRTYGASAPGQHMYEVGEKDPGDPYNMATVSDVRPLVEVPNWATHVDMTAQVIGVRTHGPAINGAALVRLGDMYGPHINWDYSDQSGTETNLVTMTAASIGHEVPANHRGTTRQITLRARFDAGAIEVQPWSVVLFTVAFTERAV